MRPLNLIKQDSDDDCKYKLVCRLAVEKCMDQRIVFTEGDRSQDLWCGVADKSAKVAEIIGTEEEDDDEGDD